MTNICIWCIWYSKITAICKYPQCAIITQELMRVKCQEYTGHSMNFDSTQTAQFGVLACVLIHSRKSVTPNKGLWHTVNVPFKAMFQLPWENTCMTPQSREHLASTHSHINSFHSTTAASPPLVPYIQLTIHQFYITIFTDLVTPCQLCEFHNHTPTTPHRSGVPSVLWGTALLWNTTVILFSCNLVPGYCCTDFTFPFTLSFK